MAATAIRPRQDPVPQRGDQRHDDATTSPTPTETTKRTVPLLDGRASSSWTRARRASTSSASVDVTAGPGHFLAGSVVESAATNASWGTSTRPTIFIRFLPSFCFSRSLRLRVMSPP